MSSCYLNAVGMISALGDTSSGAIEQLKSGKPKLTTTEKFSEGRPLSLGLFEQALPEIALSGAQWQSRNNRFALAALAQIRSQVEQTIERYGAHRVGVIIGTSTSGISESEAFLKQRETLGKMPNGYDYKLQEMGATAAYLAYELKVSGPAYGISTACSSGAKALATARRLLRAGVCDAVIAGGVDTMCHLTVQGFSSLEAVSDSQCNPFSVNREGINIGEAAALFLVTGETSEIELVGVGESSDAHHISAPDPSGKGAVRCMQAALDDANLAPGNVGYINLHGTATPLNDQMESRAVSEVFGATTTCSSTKPFTGHTLGAAGALEAAICWHALNAQFVPPHLWDGEADPDLPSIALATDKQSATSLNYALSNSFAFGGNNISLILKRAS